MQSIQFRKLFLNAALPLGSGIAISLAPFPLTIIALFVGLGVLLSRKWKLFISRASLALLIAGICVILPTKYSRQKIRPIEYEAMTLGEIVLRLRSDYGFHCFALQEVRGIPVRSFKTLEPLTRLTILRQLASETGTEFHDLGYCVSGATILWGYDPPGGYFELKLNK